MSDRSSLSRPLQDSAHEITPPSREMNTMMDRRTFLGTLTGGLLAAPLAAEAQAGSA